MNVSRDARITQPFVLTPEELKKLCDSIERAAKISSINAECSDELEREFKSLTELLEYENPPSKAIETLRIYAYSSDTTVWVRFYKELWHNVSFTVQGPEEKVVPIIESIDSRLSAIRPWYAVLALSDYRGILLEGFCALILYLAIQRVVLTSAGLAHTPFPSYLFMTLFGIGVFILSLLINRLVTKLRKNYFTAGVFAIGQGMTRHQNNETIRTTVFFGFLINIVAGLAIIIFYR